MDEREGERDRDEERERERERRGGDMVHLLQASIPAEPTLALHLDGA